MTRPYRQLGYLERKRIEEGLDLGYSFRRIAADLGRSPSTISREVYENRMRKTLKIIDRRHCAERRTCDIKGLCKDKCPYKGNELCSECAHITCTEVCARYEKLANCKKLNESPWVCNGCARRRICSRHRGDIWLYRADAADTASRTRRSEARCGIDMGRAEAEHAISVIRDHLARGLSPYEISVACKDTVGKSPSTIYRWIERGYGDMCNLELERKVGFKKRREHKGRTPTRHTAKRSHDEFMLLPEEIRQMRLEMDCVLGRKYDDKCILTLYHLPTKFQFALLLQEHTQDEVMRALKLIRKTASKDLFEKLFQVVLTDNGCEFADEYRLSRAIGERREGRLRLYFCDVRASEQKGSCEKNHSELRQIIPKGAIAFDELEDRDISVLMSHANSNPRASLFGMSPIAMFKAMFKEEGEELLDALGVEEIPTDRLTLKPWILNIERDHRGEEPLHILL